ncbi:MAG: hypothetical protein NZ585_05050 [Chloracidobacterium sp.]|nr:hypothetical protein [Chloracidobacterium sp.]
MMEEAAGRPKAALAQWRRIEVLAHRLAEAGCVGKEAQVVSSETLANVMRLTAQCGNRKAALAAAREFETHLAAFPPDELRRMSYLLGLLKSTDDRMNTKPLSGYRRRWRNGWRKLIRHRRCLKSAA